MEDIFDLRGNRYWLLCIPGDGDCLFGSLVHQMYGVTPKNRLFKPYSEQLREIAVREIRSRIEYYYESLVPYACEFVSGAMSLDDRVQSYLEMLRSPGVWAGTECISAISNYFRVSIHIHQSNTCIRFDPIENDNESPSTYHIFYRAVGGDSLGERNHFDSVIIIRSSDYALTPNPTPTATVPLCDDDFEVVAAILHDDQESLWKSIGHQLTGETIGQNSVYLLRSLIADECQALTPDELSSLGFPTEDLDTFLFHLKIGRCDGGRGSLIILSIIMNLTVLLHSTNQETIRLNPARCRSSVRIELLEDCRSAPTRYSSVMKVKRCRPNRVFQQQDTIEVAQKIARVEICATPEMAVTPVVIDERSGLKFASINVNGCRSIEKRDTIDALLVSRGVHLAVLQEVNLQGNEALTANYRWYPGQKSRSSRRGLAILVRINADIRLNVLKNFGPNIQLTEISYRVRRHILYSCDFVVSHIICMYLFQTASGCHTLNVANVHGPNQKNAGFFSGLGSLVSGLKDSRNLLIAGDFNSQLGFSNLAVNEKSLIGKYVGHELFNENGQQMRFFLNLHLFSARNTQANASFLTTWSVGDRASQIDHLLTHVHSLLFLRRMQCTLPGDVSTDHRLLLASVVENRSVLKTAPNKAPANPRSDVDPSLLSSRTIQKKFIESLQNYHPSCPVSDDVDAAWNHIKDKLSSSASTILKRSTQLPPTRECRLALAEVKRCTFWASRSCQPKWNYKLAEAREKLRVAVRESEEKSIMDFFKNLQKFPVGQRINRTYKYLKRFKKRKNNVSRASVIKFDDWIQRNEVSESMMPTYSKDPSDSVTAVDPPTLDEIKDILSGMKNGKSPGVDNLYTEYYKHCDDETLSELHHLLVEVFTKNQLPAEWKKVVMVPIPKIRQPKTVDDYRRISLTCTAYKIYSTWILSKLQSYVGQIGTHQAAFLPERSTTDHLHVLQRVLQEKWNEGTPLVLMSLDIEKAFDRVSLTSLPSILRGNLFRVDYEIYVILFFPSFRKRSSSVFC